MTSDRQSASNADRPDRPTVPVLVIGAGPVGLATAIALRRRGIECRVVERHGSTLDFPKGRGLSARTMEIFRSWELEDEITAAGLPRTDTEHFFLAETLLAPEFTRFDRAALGRLPTPSPTERLICAQDVVERVLLERALALGAIVEFSTELVALAQDGSGVTATVEDRPTGRRRSVDAAYVVAADGGRSTARDLLGIGTSGPGRIGHSVSILVEAELAPRVADRLAIIYKVAQPHPSAFFAVVDNDRRWLLMMARDPLAEPDESFTDEHCLALVRAALGDDDVPLRLRGHRFFEPTALVADRFGVGRVLLAGDAAHVTTPFGALGMNCGIADAHNLAWKLAGVLQGWAGPGLVDSYETERRPVALATVDASILREDISGGPPRTAFDGVTLGYGYDSPVVVADGTTAPPVDDPVHNYVPTARPGHRAPHVWVGHDARRTSTLDLFGDGFVLLSGGHAAADPAIGELAHDLGIPARVHAIDAGRPGDELRAAYDIGDEGLVVVRPDGHVAWRRRDGPVGPGDLAQILTVVVGRGPLGEHA